MQLLTGTSGYSSPASATPTAVTQPSVPGAPTGLMATAGNAQVALVWTATSGASSYQIQRATVSGGPYTQVATSTTAGYTNTGLTNGTTYYFKVASVNPTGVGTLSPPPRA